ncbi:hypothetical protein IQ07DRAFT_606479 [Pyrenochaeta sp. DS3sAY3a]|nr:hypothetical protein IQ07DRAFT_606479 [Pyrenochaeta sp. DS3sAY3a]
MALSAAVSRAAVLYDTSLDQWYNSRQSIGGESLCLLDGRALDKDLRDRPSYEVNKPPVERVARIVKKLLAIEHAYRTRPQSPEMWVLWVHASAARFYLDIADRVKFVGRRDPQANIFKLVHDWLCDCKQRWSAGQCGRCSLSFWWSGEWRSANPPTVSLMSLHRHTLCCGLVGNNR